MNRIAVGDCTIRFDAYRVEHLAVAAALESRRWIVLGDDGRYWLVRPVDGERLVVAGYELRLR